MPSPDTLTEQRIAELLADEAIPVALRALWALLWEGELRLGDALSLDVRDIGLTESAARVGYPKRGGRPVRVPIGALAAALLQQAIGGRTEGPALQLAGRPISRESAARHAHASGVSIHTFRSSGQASRYPH